MAGRRGSASSKAISKRLRQLTLVHLGLDGERMEKQIYMPDSWAELQMEFARSWPRRSRQNLYVVEDPQHNTIPPGTCDLKAYHVVVFREIPRFGSTESRPYDWETTYREETKTTSDVLV